MKETKKIAISAILCALSIVVLMLGSIITVLDLTMVGIASLMIVIAVIEIGGWYPYLVWLVTGTLSLLLLTDKFAALLYFLFGGIYPILKTYFEKLPFLFSWLCKLLCFNGMLTLFIFACNEIFMIPDTDLAFGWAVYGFCNLVFVLYDLAATELIALYRKSFRKRLRLGRIFGSGEIKS